MDMLPRARNRVSKLRWSLGFPVFPGLPNVLHKKWRYRAVVLEDHAQVEMLMVLAPYHRSGPSALTSCL